MERKPETKREVVQKPVDWFIPKDNIRKHYGEDYLERLGQSLMARQWHPVIAMANRELVDGFGRLLAAKQKNIPFLDTIILEGPLSQTELRLAQGQTAMHRADLTGWEKYQLLYEIAQLNPNWQAKELAEHLAIDPTMVTKIMAASNTPSEVRAALKDGKLSTSDVYALSRLPEAEQLATLNARLTGEIASRDDLERAVRQRKRPTAETDAKRATRMKAVLSSGATITVAREGLDITGLIDALAEFMKAAKKAERDRLDVKTFEAILRDQAK